jgi:flagellin-like hook-associated protein FlgL
MSTVINTNFAASTAAYNLDRTNQNLQRSLNRLSSGSRINSAYDDAGGLAVSMKLSAAIRRSQAVNANVGNSLAFLQTQDGVMKTADKVLSRMSELTSMALDVTKNPTDIANYDAEFKQLQQQLAQFSTEKFNGISLFLQESLNATPASSTAGALKVVTSEDGSQSSNISIHAINTDPWLNMLKNGFVSFSDPSNSSRRIFVPNPPQDVQGYLETGEVFDLDQTTSITQTWTDTFSLPPGHLNRAATIPAHNYMNGTTSMTAATAVTVPVTISATTNPPLTSLGGNNYGLVPPTNPPYTTTPTYRQLAENVRSGNYIDPLHAGTTSTSSITVSYTPTNPVYTRASEDGSTTSAIALNVPTDTATVTMTLEPWSGNGIAATAANVSNSRLIVSSAEEFGIVARMALQSLATMRAQNGAEQSRLTFAQDMLSVNQTNLESAVSRIMDVDVAVESTQLARFNILQQAGTAMLAQANQNSQSLLRLITQN